MRIFITLLFLIPLLFSCSTKAQDRGSVLPIYTDSKTPIQLKAGTIFGLKLDSNPTTGYEWMFIEEPDSSIVKFVKKTYESDDAPPEMTGVGGDEYWTFRTVVPGKIKIKLKYVRPWEADEPEPLTEIFTIIVD